MRRLLGITASVLVNVALLGNVGGDIGWYLSHRMAPKGSVEVVDLNDKQASGILLAAMENAG